MSAKEVWLGIGPVCKIWLILCRGRQISWEEEKEEEEEEQPFLTDVSAYVTWLVGSAPVLSSGVQYTHCTHVFWSADASPRLQRPCLVLHSSFKYTDCRVTSYIMQAYLCSCKFTWLVGCHSAPRCFPSFQ